MTSAERQKWLAQTIEEPLDPSLPICDAHHHLWYNTDNNYTAEDYLQDISGGHHIRQSVFVESRLMQKETGPQELRPAGETEFVVDITSRSNAGKPTAIAAGIIGFADLTLGASVTPVLEAHISAGKNRFRGIRYTTAWDASPALKSRWGTPSGLLQDRRFREGFAVLRDYDLTFDAWLYHPQLMELVGLARAFPDNKIIVNHTGGPLGTGPYALKKEVVLNGWKRCIEELSRCPNVYMKLGGLGMRISGYGWSEAAEPPDSAELAAAFAPYYLWCIEKFGIDRCMFESNFPVDKASYSYTVLWNAFKRLTANFSYEERLALFHDTAVKAYRLTGWNSN